jgi:AcrR family transcriptional regulator
MPAVPTTPKGLRTRQSIVVAARQVFARDGFVNARMSDVAVAAELSLGGLYRYFENKEDLFEAVVANIHEELYRASVSSRYSLATEPFEALLEANRGYLQLYSDNRDVMRAFMEAAHVDTRFRDIWWAMRNRHIERFTEALQRVRRDAGSVDDGLDVRLAAEAAACMAEQSAYVWFAQDALHAGDVSVEHAATAITRGWHAMFFAPPPTPTH